MSDNQTIDNVDVDLKENTRLVAAVMHLKYASDLIKDIDIEISLVLLQTADAIITEYNIGKSEIDELKQIEHKISSND